MRAIEHGEPPLKAALNGARADRLHDRVDHGVAPRGLRAHPPHGRDRGPPLPRVRGHAQRGGRHVGARLADADADDVLAPAAVRAGRAARAAVRARRSARSTAMLAFYERGLGWALRHRVTMLLVTLGTVGAQRRALLRRAAKGLFPQQDTGLLMASTEAAQDVSYRADVRAADAGQRGPPRRIRTSTTTCRSSARAASAPATPAPRSSQLKPRPPRAIDADGVLGRLRGQAGEDRGDQHVPAVAAGRERRRAPGADAVPVHAAGREPRRAPPRGRRRCSTR